MQKVWNNYDIKTMSSKLPRIVVVGGGAGGLELVTTLGKTIGKKGLAKVYLTNGSPTHVWKPLLHEVATGALNVGEDEVNYFTHAHQSGYRFHYGWMNGIDRQRKVIKIDTIKDLEGNVVHGPREVPYDTLVMAVGGNTNCFGTPGVRENCFRLDSPEEAERLRIRILGHALAFAFNKVSKIRVGIVGGGPTGVELASEIHRTMTEIKAYGVDIPNEALEITILEAGPKILAGTLPHMSEFAIDQLNKRGIRVLTNSRIKGVNEVGFQLGDGSTLEKDIKVWSAGIKAPEWLAHTGMQVDRLNRIRVNKYLQCVDDPSIFAIGDCSTGVDPKDPTKVFPATAQCAHQQAEWLATKIKNDLLNKETKNPFQFVSQGMLVSLGHTTAVGTMSGLMSKSDLHIRGRSAKFLYSTLYRMHQAAVYGKLNALFIWLGDKLRGATLPQIKLH